MYIQEINKRIPVVLLVQAGIIALLMMGSIARAQTGPGQEVANEPLTEEEFLQQVRSRPGHIQLAAAPTEQVRKVMFDIVRANVTDQPTTRVIVGIDMPEYTRLRDLSVGQRDPVLSAEADRRLAEAIRKAVDQELNRLPPNSFEVLATFTTVPAVLMKVDARALRSLEAAEGVLSIKIEGVAQPLLDDTVNLVEASRIWARGFEASDWYVAVLDSGILATHEAFAGRDIIQACYNWSGSCPNGLTADTTSPNAARHHSGPCFSDHGTHVSGIAASNGQVDGVARAANLIAIQVFACFNDEALAYEGDIYKGLEFVYSNRNNYNIASVNMSLGSAIPSPMACDNYWTTFTTMVANLKSVDIATVAASGNDGNCFEVSWPACISHVIAVGATDNFFNGMYYTNTDILNSEVLDLYAPGDEVYAPVGTSNTDYGNKSGTSMASPHVAGGIALMRDVLSAYVPDLTQDPTVDELEAALLATGWPVYHTWCGPFAPAPQTKIRLVEAIGVFLDPGRTWVDFGSTGTEDGDWAYPFNTLSEAAQNAADNDTLLIHAGSSAEAVTINRPLTLTAVDGVVTIGQ